MSAFLTAFETELLKHVPELVITLLGLFAAAAAWVVSWLRAHTTASAVRQAQRAHGDSAVAEQEAADELQLMPRLLRPGNVERAVSRAVAKTRASEVQPKS